MLAAGTACSVTSAPVWLVACVPGRTAIGVYHLMPACDVQQMDHSGLFGPQTQLLGHSGTLRIQQFVVMTRLRTARGEASHAARQ